MIGSPKLSAEHRAATPDGIVADDVEIVVDDELTEEQNSRLKTRRGRLSINERQESTRKWLAVSMLLFLGATILLCAFPIIVVYFFSGCLDQDYITCRVSELETAQTNASFFAQALFTPVLGVFGAVMAFYYGGGPQTGD